MSQRAKTRQHMLSIGFDWNNASDSDAHNDGDTEFTTSAMFTLGHQDACILLGGMIAAVLLVRDSTWINMF